MNIKKENIDDLNAVLTVKIEPEDYEERVNNVLSDYRKKARLDGFRPGKVPFGLIRKLYYKPVLMEEVNKILGESVSKYFKEEKLYIIGEPLPHDDQFAEFDWDKDKEFAFAYDIGLAPEMILTVSENDIIPFYQIMTNDEAVNSQIDQIRSRFGSFKEVESVSGNEVVKADLQEANEEGKPLEEGLRVEGGSIYVEHIADQKIRDQFTSCKAGDQIVIDVKAAFPNEVDLAGLLKVEKGRLAEINNQFILGIKSVSSFEKAEMNQELFDKVYGKDIVTSEEAFRRKVEEDVRRSFEQESLFRFRVDAKKYFIDQFRQSIPDEFYKRWILHVKEGKMTSEQLEKDYPDYVEDLKWQLIKNKVMRTNDLEVTDEDLITLVMEMYRSQFAQYYGVTNAPDEILEKYAREALEKDDERHRFTEMVKENKVYEFLKNNVKLEPKEVTLDDFKKLYDQNS